MGVNGVLTLLVTKGVAGGGGAVEGPTTQSVGGGGSELVGVAGASAVGWLSGEKIRGSSLSFTAHRFRFRAHISQPTRPTQCVVLHNESSKGRNPNPVS